MKNKFSLKLIIFFTLVLFLFIKPYYTFLKKIAGVSPIWLLISKDSFKQTDGKVNILVLGKPDFNNDGPNLTDSIIVFSFNIKSLVINLISIPRDIWSNTLNDKINSAYAYGEAKKPEGGFTLAKAEIEAVIDQPIHYAILIDFEEFKELIDYFGGVDVYVERGFKDFKYPIKGRENDLCDGDPEYRCRYESLSFVKGWQHMNGDLALKFVRTRNAKGEEGSDFARNKRQQKIIIAVYEKIINKVKKLNVKELEAMYSLIDKIVKRDIPNKEAVYIGKRIIFSKNIKINQSTLSQNFFITPQSDQYSGRYVLIPEDENYNLIYQYVDCVFNKQDVGSCNKFTPKDSSL
jgi:LCP family protein required for cell wall assembly